MNFSYSQVFQILMSRRWAILNRLGAVAAFTLLWVLLFAQGVAGQTVSADRFTLKTGPCTMRSGSGIPSPTLGVICDTYIDYTTGLFYTRGLFGWVASTLSGTGTANTIAKWTGTTVLGNSTITDTGAIVTVSPSGNVIFANGGDIIFNPTGNDLLPNTPYDINIGMLTNKFLSLHAAELWVETLVAQDTLATIGGRVLVGPTNILAADLTAGATTMTVKYNNFANGDRVYMEAAGSVEFMAITSSASGSAGAYTYTMTRNLDGTGANAWSAGDAVFNTGTTGNGFIDLYSTRGVKAGTEIGPTIVGNVRTGTTYNQWEPRWAIGNLNGLYGFSGSNYGAAFGTPSGTRITIEPTNGIKLYDSAGTARVSIGPGATATFTGTTSGDGSGITNINGGNIQTDTITASQIAANAITVNELAAGSVTADKLVVGTGSNLIRNSECRVSTEGWAFNSNMGLAGQNIFAPAFSPWRMLDEPSACYMTGGGTPAINTVMQAYSGMYPASPGKRYEASVYIGAHRATPQVYIFFYDISNNILATPGATICTLGVDCGAGGTSEAGWSRGGVVATAPAGTAQIRFMTQTIAPGGQADPYLFFTKMYMGEAKANQTELSDWSPAGMTEITGGMIKTDSVDARIIAADSITASEIAANAITTSELNADSVTSAKIAAGTIVASDIASSTITATQIAGGTITGTQIAAGAITAGHISSHTITTNEIATGTIQAGNMNVSSLSAITANLGTVTAGTITGTTISGNSITGGTIAISGGGGLFDVTSNGNLTVVNVSATSIGTAGLSATSSISNSAWAGGGVRGLCTDNTGLISPAGVNGCFGGAELLAANDEVGDLKKQIDALKAEVANLQSMVANMLNNLPSRE